MGHIAAIQAAAITPFVGAPSDTTAPVSGGAVLLRVLEAAQRMVAYCDNAAVGGAEDPALELIGIPTPGLNRAMRDLVGAVHAMNAAMTSEASCAALAALHRVPGTRREARPDRGRRQVAKAMA
jgi:hypothetical protein